MRKTMTKEVTKTSIKLADMEVVEGVPKAKALPDEIVLGNVSMEKAQKLMNKKFNRPITVFEVQADTTTYEMPVDKFIELASIKEDEPKEETKSTVI